MTTAVFSESELKTALKRKCVEIEIIGSYADTVMDKYGSYLTGRSVSSIWTVAGGPCSFLLANALVWQRDLSHYKVEGYRKGDNLKIKKKSFRW